MTPREQGLKNKRLFAVSTRCWAGLVGFPHPVPKIPQRVLLLLAGRSITSHDRTSDTVPALSHTAHPTSHPHPSRLVLLPK